MSAKPIHLPGAAMVAANLVRSRGKWHRFCPRWWNNGSPAAWTTSEPKLRAAADRARATGSAA